MKVIDKRIQELRSVLANCTVNTDGRTALEYQINRLEAGIIEALLIVRRDGYKQGEIDKEAELRGI